MTYSLQMENRIVLHETIDTPVSDTCDVLVAGGGTAGVLCAVAAARQGARTILVEGNSVLGGDMLGGGISWLSYYNVFRQFHAEPKQVVFGLAYELLQRLVEAGDSPGFYEDYAPETQESRGTHADREGLRHMLFRLAHESGVKLYLESTAVDVLMDNRTIQGIIVESFAGRFAIAAKRVVDCTGDGDIAMLAGANCKEMPTHAVGMAFGVAPVDFDKAYAYGRSHNAMAHDCTGAMGRYRGKPVKYTLCTRLIPELKEAVHNSGIHGNFGTTIMRDGEASYINGVNVNGPSNGLDSKKTTDTVLQLRQNIRKSVGFLRNNIPGFENCRLSWTTPVVGTRHARYVECDYDISAEHVAKALIPEDSIGLFGSQDAHYLGHYIEGGKWYGIPYRALLPKFVENLLVAGRMISSDWVAHMSTRLMVSCFVQGQAAGTAAALSIQNNCTVRQLDAQELRSVLKASGVFLDNDEKGVKQIDQNH